MVKRPPLQPANDPARAEVCEHKAIYKSEVSARTVGQYRLREHHISGDANAPTRFWPYACARCRHWHLTSMESPGLAITARQQREGMDDPTS